MLPASPPSPPDTRCPADIRLGRAGGFQVARRYPPKGQVAVTFASGRQAREGASRRPSGVTVAGGVKSGQARRGGRAPARRAANGQGRAHAQGQAEGRQDDRPRRSTAARRRPAWDLDALLAKRLKGPADVKGLARRARREAVRQARAGQRRRRSSRRSVWARAPAPPAPSAPAAAPGGRRAPAAARAAQRRPTPTRRRPARRARNGADDDNDGQTDLRGPGLRGRQRHDRGQRGHRVRRVQRERLGRRHGRRPDRGSARASTAAGRSRRSRIDVAPGIASCRDSSPAAPRWTCAAADRDSRSARRVDTADVNLELTGPVNCARPATIALYRPNGEVAELRGAGRAAAAPAASRPCANGKDDDGDGMIDDHFADGATDPGPGLHVRRPTPSEDSEIAAPDGLRDRARPVERGGRHTRARRPEGLRRAARPSGTTRRARSPSAATASG